MVCVISAQGSNIVEYKHFLRSVRGRTRGAHRERGHKHARGRAHAVGPHHERVGQREEEQQGARVRIETVQRIRRQRLAQVDDQPQRLAQRREEQLRPTMQIYSASVSVSHVILAGGEPCALQDSNVLPYSRPTYPST